MYLMVPVQEQHEHSFYSCSTNTFITGISVHGTRFVTHRTVGALRPLGEVGLTPRQYTEWNVVGRARSTGGPSNSRGCCLKCTVLAFYREVCSPTRLKCLTSPTNYQQRTPDPSVWVVYIAGDTLRHQPMGASHMTMLQLRGPIGSCVLPWWLFIER